MWDIRVKPQLDGTVDVEFWHKDSFKFKIKGFKDDSGEAFTNSGHYRASLIPNIMNGLMVTTRRPD